MVFSKHFNKDCLLRKEYLVVLVVLLGMLVVGCQSGFHISRSIVPPMNLVVSRASGSAFLTWDASTDSDIAGYNIYEGLTNDASELATVGYTLNTLTTYSDEGLDDMQGYYYAVSAVTVGSEESSFADIVYSEPYIAEVTIIISREGNLR